jgi:hypothetical protein
MAALPYLAGDSNLKRIQDFRYKGAEMPLLLAGGFTRYFEHHVPPGDFLKSVLSNDLTGSLRRAESLELVELCVSFLTWHAPTQAWGSAEKVSRWLQVNGELPFDWDTHLSEAPQ